MEFIPNQKGGQSLLWNYGKSEMAWSTGGAAKDFAQQESQLTTCTQMISTWKAEVINQKNWILGMRLKHTHAMLHSKHKAKAASQLTVVTLHFSES